LSFGLAVASSVTPPPRLAEGLGVGLIFGLAVG
jgi:hypothetical protein